MLGLYGSGSTKHSGGNGDASTCGYAAVVGEGGRGLIVAAREEEEEHGTPRRRSRLIKELPWVKVAPA